MKKLSLIFIAILMVSFANANWQPTNGTNDKQLKSSVGIPTANTLNVKEILTTYTITISSNPTNGGYIFGGGTFNLNDTCVLHAYPYTGYTFVNWTENGNVVSLDTNYIFLVYGNRNLVANFAVLQYNVTTSANPVIGGVTMGDGMYNSYQSCVVNATANAGYTFTNWTENGSVVSFDTNYTFWISFNRNLVANFTTSPYTINVYANPTSGGIVSGEGVFSPNQTCTVQANCYSGNTFANWTENGIVVSTSQTYQFTVTSNRILLANFNINQFTITTSSNPTIGGTTTGDGTFNYYQNCTVKATPNTAYTFVNWSESGYVVSYDSIYSFVLDSNRILVANFSTDPFAINISLNDPNAGYAYGGGTFVANQECTVIAQAYQSYTFLNWTENGNVVSTSYIYSFTVTASRNLVANYELSCSAIFSMVADTTTPHHYYVLSNVMGVAPFHYHWTWGDGTSDSIAYPSHTYSAAGIYTICLEIYTSTGCESYYCDSSYIQKSTNSIIKVDVIQQGTLGITSNSESNNIKIYPNPAKDYITIDSKSNTAQRLEIINLVGQTVYSTTINKKVKVNISAFANGVYILKLNSDKETVVKKFVKE